MTKSGPKVAHEVSSRADHDIRKNRHPAFLPVFTSLFLRWVLPPLRNRLLDEYAFDLAEYYPVILAYFFIMLCPLRFAVLVGSLHHHLEAAEDPAAIDQVARFAPALGDLADPDTLVIAGVDFSHVGPKFGHEAPATSFELDFRAHDQALLAEIQRGSAAGFWSEARRVQDRWHVCGLPVVAVLLQALEGLTGDVRLHDVWFEEPTRSAVSYASVLLS